jgi:hypothetical protein
MAADQDFGPRFELFDYLSKEGTTVLDGFKSFSCMTNNCDFSEV